MNVFFFKKKKKRRLDQSNFGEFPVLENF